jgi:signal transduction histidine kinase
VGVPPELLKKVFDKFRQVQARRAGAAVGFGLGLTFCRLAVQAQGGRIWMESQPNVETTVYFSLPSP